MWWILPAGLVAGLLGLEVRRFVRARAAERDASGRYALYRASEPERALAIVDVGVDDRQRPMSRDAATSVPAAAAAADAAEDRTPAAEQHQIAAATAAEPAPPGLPQ